MLIGQNRFTALRQFAIQTCNASALNAGCTLPDRASRPCTRARRTPSRRATPRPVSPELLLRSFDIPATTATHVRIVVLTNQCTGNTAYQDPATSDDDDDPTNDTDCRLGLGALRRRNARGSGRRLGCARPRAAARQRPHRRAAGLRPAVDGEVAPAPSASHKGPAIAGPFASLLVDGGASRGGTRSCG